MTKIDIISGFLGAGKTTFIKQLLKEAISGEKVVLIENEFGEIGIDGGFLRDAGIEIREMNSGCICCSLVGDFGKSLEEVLMKYHPDRVIIEPSGVGKLSDVMKAVRDVASEIEVMLNSAVTVVDVNKCRMYMKNFGEFFNNQIENAGTIVLSRTDITDAAKVQKDVDMLREKNRDAVIITTPLAELSGAQLLEIIEKHDTMLDDLLAEVRESRQLHEEECHEHHHHDEEGCHEHHHHEGEECHERHHHDGEEGHEHHHEGEECHGHHHHDGEECHEHHHHDGEECHEHHHDGEECHGHHHHDGEECHEHHHDGEEGHEHHHHDGEECHDHHHHDHGCCGHDHGHHHADEVFTSWGKETIHTYTKDEVSAILKTLEEDGSYGNVLRAKGMVAGADGEWIYFDMVPEEHEVRTGAPEYTGRICVIGAELNEDKLAELFKLK